MASVWRLPVALRFGSARYWMDWYSTPTSRARARREVGGSVCCMAQRRRSAYVYMRSSVSLPLCRCVCVLPVEASAGLGEVIAWQKNFRFRATVEATVEPIEFRNQEKKKCG